MILKPILFLTALLTGFSALSHELSLELSSFPAETPQHISVTTLLTIRNSSSLPVNLAIGSYGEGVGFQIKFMLTRPNGTRVPVEEMHALTVEGFKLKILAPGEVIYKRTVVTDAREAGDFTFVAAVSSHGPYEFKDTPNPPTEKDIWSGEIRLSRPIRVIEPKGEDRAAIDYFHSLRVKTLYEQQMAVIEKYPHTLYAATFIAEIGVGDVGNTKIYTLESAAKATPEVRLNALSGGGASYVMKKGTTQFDIGRRSYHAEYRKERIVEGRKHYESRVKLYRMVEEDRPQFSGMARIRKNNAFALYLLSRDQEAEDEVRALAKLQGQEAEEARAVMKSCNISAEPPKPWWKVW